LFEEGVEIIDPQGEVFDPHLHEAVDSSSEGNESPQHIIEVLQVGYQLKGKLIRSARVKVSE
jgi:molecular chaperone GrpE